MFSGLPLPPVSTSWLCPWGWGGWGVLCYTMGRSRTAGECPPLGCGLCSGQPKYSTALPYIILDFWFWQSWVYRLSKFAYKYSHLNNLSGFYHQICCMSTMFAWMEFLMFETAGKELWLSEVFHAPHLKNVYLSFKIDIEKCCSITQMFAGWFVIAWLKRWFHCVALLRCYTQDLCAYVASLSNSWNS